MASDSLIPKTYDGPRAEKRWSQYWRAERLFEANPDAPGQAYSIVIPPPNVTGSLHMGHALNVTIQDILVRWQRMRGRNVLWIPGTDHAGIATQNVVERHLARDGLTRRELGRQKFEEKVWEWKQQYEARILGQIERMGCSCDWSRTRFTMDEGLSKAVREVFVRLYEDNLIYRGEYLVNWCPRCSTAISDLEVIHSPSSGKLWRIRYPLASGRGSVEVATTRPETMLGDTAVAVHPEDERYASLVGQNVRLPLVEKDIPIIADDFVDREFGTGVVKVTPGHDPNDFEAGRRHELPIVLVIGEDGKMTEAAGAYAGLDRFEARKRVVEQLQERGLLAGIDTHEHSVGRCQRCETVVEPLVSTQWFVRIKTLAEPAIETVDAGETVFVPSRYKKIYLNWMHNIHDWCISRQLWWGHRIPAWYCDDCSHIVVSRDTPGVCDKCGSSSLRQDEDVLDTWFSSGLWPFSTMGWPEDTVEQRVYYPTSTLVTASDIIFFWVARMMMLGLRFKGSVPFRKVHITGLVRDDKGRKMSKTVGNVIDPLEIVEEYGADAVRFTLSVSAAPGTDIPFSVSRMAGYRAFCNKIWNAGRFLLLNLQEREPVEADEIERLRSQGLLQLEDRWILSRLQETLVDLERNLSRFRFHEASNGLYHFFWDEFCSWYIELIKARFDSPDETEREVVNTVALHVLDCSLRLLHPFMPFVTEELWQKLPHEGPSISVSSFPERRKDWIDEEAVESARKLQDLISAIRTARTENQVPPRQQLPCQLKVGEDNREFVLENESRIKAQATLNALEIVSEIGNQGMQVRGISSLGEFALSLEDVIDVQAERERLGRQIQKIEQEVQGLEARLDNSAFIEKAPAHVVEEARSRLGDARERLARLLEQRNELSGS